MSKEHKLEVRLVTVHGEVRYKYPWAEMAIGDYFTASLLKHQNEAGFKKNLRVIAKNKQIEIDVSKSPDGSFKVTRIR